MMRDDHPKADLQLKVTPGPDGARVEGRDGCLHYLNPTAAVVWLLADGSRNIDGLADAVAEQFGLPSVPKADIERALCLLSERGLLQGGYRKSKQG